MKVRQGFVSNSSSSSFIVACDIWEVKLQKLNRDGTYNHEAKIKSMSDDVCCTEQYRLKSFAIDRRMKKVKKEVSIKIDYFINK